MVTGLAFRCEVNDVAVSVYPSIFGKKSEFSWLDHDRVVFIALCTTPLRRNIGKVN